MQVLVIIGGIGSGKSSVVGFLKQRDIPTLDLDKVGHEILHNPEVKEALCDSFGEEIFDGERNLDRKALAKKAFASPETTALLESITWPSIFSRLEQWLADKSEKGNKIVAVEISAYKPEDKQKLLDMGFAIRVVAVVAPSELRIKRAHVRGFDSDDIAQRMARQIPDTDRMNCADYVIENTGSLSDMEQVVNDMLDGIVDGQVFSDNK